MKNFCVGLLLLIFASAAFGQAALDPSRLAIGGRALGLGRTFVGLADDSTSIFLNPAGLATLPDWQATSMTGRFAEEYTYVLLGGAYPTNLGVLGIAFVGASVGGVPVTTLLEGTESDPIYVIDYTQDAIDYYNNVYFLSWAKEVPNIFNYKLPWPTQVGANLKIFNTSLTGDGIVDGIGTGTEVDLGVLLEPRSFLKIGAVGHNVLPYSMGGKLTYASDYSEYYPASYAVGGSLNILGDPDKSIYRFNQQLRLLADAEINRNYPVLWHIGAEWNPLPLIALRVGIDQDVSVDTAGVRYIESGMAYGVGVTYGGFRFDYAFHQFPGLPGIDNSYFSFSYGLFEKREPKPDVPMEIYSPEDKLLTFDSSVKLQGKLLDPRITSLYVNGMKVKFNLEGSFETTVDLKEGKNLIQINARSGKELVAAEKIRILRLKIFPDVGSDYWVAKPISLLAMQGIITGYPDGSFKPEGSITRAEICTLLMKTSARGKTTEVEPLFEPLSLEFKDVPEGHWAAPFIAEAAQAEVVKGYPDGTFKPKNNITRAEGVVMITRFAKIKKWAYAGEFSDVAYEHWAAKMIAAAGRTGMLKFLEGKRFQPNRKLTRAETVELLYRSPYVQDLLDSDLLDWSNY